jgi:flagellar hook-associated protein 3 FlgL
MISNLSPKEDNFLRSVTTLQQRMQKAQREMSSGRRVHSAVDAPDEISAMLSVRAARELNVTLKTNLTRVQSEVDAAESSLERGEQILDRARSIATQGLTDTQTPEGRRAMSREVDGLLRQMVQVAGATSEGRYVFSGDNDSTPPFSFDNTGALSAYAGSAATRQVLIDSTLTISVSQSGDQIFRSADPAKDVMQSLIDLRDALSANDMDALKAAFQKVGTAQTHLSEIHAGYGSIQRRVADATKEATAADSRLAIQLSRLEDADLTASILELRQSETGLEAAYNAKAREPRKSLFDYLG